MGTNYYLTYNTCLHCNRSDTLHIGKSSAGWKFTFHKTPQTNNVTKWRKLTKQGTITDEYGREWSHRKFWQLVANKQKETRSAGEDIHGYSFTEGEFS